jgi:DNA repair photolyase
MNNLFAPGLINKVVKYPSINNLITRSDGFVKKELSTFKLDIMGLCGFGCRYCSSNSGLGIKFRKNTFENACNDQLGRVISPHDDPSLTYEYFDLLPNLERQLKKKPKKWGAGQTLVFSELTDAFSPNLVNKGITKYVLKQVLDRTSFRVRVLTKNACVGTDEWVKFFDKYWDRITVGLSTGNIDDNWTKKVELGTSLPSERFTAIQNLQDAGINTFGMLCPVFPDIVKEKRVGELVEMINPGTVETIWAEPYNDRDNWNVVQSGFQPDSYLYNWFEDEYEKKLGIWSEYATDLYVQLYEHAEKNGWSTKLKYLLYESKINENDSNKFRGLIGVLPQNKPGDDGFSKNRYIAKLQKETNIPNFTGEVKMLNTRN